MNIPAILDRIRPDAEWNWRGSYVGEGAGDYNLLDWRDTAQTKPTLAEIEADWTDYVAEEQALSEQLGREQAVIAAANTAVMDIPGWAAWTEDEALNWIQANVNDLSSAKQTLKAMSRLLIALRNRTWPQLEGDSD